MKSEANMSQIPFNMNSIKNSLWIAVTNLMKLLIFYHNQQIWYNLNFSLETAKKGFVKKKDVSQYTTYKSITDPVVNQWRQYYCIGF